MPVPYGLGFFGNGPDTAAFAPSLAAFEALMGCAPTIFNVYMDFTQTALPNTGSAGYDASSYNTSGKTAGSIPLIGMTLSSSADSTATNVAFLEALATTTQYDTAIEGMVTDWVNAGFKTLYWRPVVEMNLTSTPGFASWETNPSILVAALQKVYTLIHTASAAQGVTSVVIWNPGCSNSSPAGLATSTLYPGDEYCDWIGGDWYDDLYPMAGSVATIEASPELLEAYYANPAEGGSNATCLSLTTLMDFALAHNKPFCLPETGCGDNPSDNATFPAWTRATLDAYVAKGLKIEFVSIWSNGSYDFTTGSKPNEAAAWAAAFGANAPAIASAPPAVPATPVVAPPAPVTPVTPPQAAASPAGTTISNGSGAITDTLGQVWTIKGGQFLIGSAVVSSSWDVTTGWWFGGELYQLNQQGEWYQQPLSNVAGTPLTGTPPGYAPTMISTTALPQSQFTVVLSADEYQGNAQVTIAVDGKVVAAELPVTAVRASNQTQAFSWAGSYGAGTHTVTVEFTNDDYGGSQATDRNAYFISVSVDGDTVTLAQPQLASTGSTGTATVTTKY